MEKLKHRIWARRNSDGKVFGVYLMPRKKFLRIRMLCKGMKPDFTYDGDGTYGEYRHDPANDIIIREDIYKIYICYNRPYKLTGYVKTSERLTTQIESEIQL